MLNLGGNSRQSLSAIRVVLDGKLKGLSAVECTAVSADLFNVLLALQSSGALRRAVTDPARDHEAKSASRANGFQPVRWAAMAGEASDAANRSKDEHESAPTPCSSGLTLHRRADRRLRG